MTMKEFIHKYQKEIDATIGIPTNDRVRELWVYHDDHLNSLAKKEGVI